MISPKSIDADYAAMEDGATSGTVISENPIGTGYFKFKVGIQVMKLFL